MAKGFDTTANCSSSAAAIRAAGYDFVGRYLSRSSWKVISAAEAAALTGAGLSVVLVYEDGPTASSYFSGGRGTSDATRAALQATAIGAPAATTLYFAVDYDASAADIAGPITAYFQGIAGAATGFQIGVYGSGATCSAITGAGLAGKGWLACSRGWAGHAAYEPAASIVQALPATLLGLSVDPDEGNGAYGGFP
jgi:Rv2525c-like, glycoside hydrolase-like domain